MYASLPPDPLPTTECLEAFGFHPLVAGVLMRSPAFVDHGGGLLLELRADGSGTIIEAGLESPTDLLLGVRVDPHLVGLAVIASGVVRSSDDRSIPVGAELVTAQQVLIDGTSRCFGFDRASLSRRLSGGRFLGTDCAGAQHDALLRALGLATPAPELPVEWYWMAVWLADLVPLGTTCTVVEAARWHPGIDPRSLDDLSPGEIERFVARAHRQHAEATGWEGVRRGAIAGWLDLGWCPPEIARWLDEGSMSRWLADQLPWPDELLLWIDINLSGRVQQLARDLLALTRGGPHQ